ncbi:MAG: hypothetical protein LC731_04685, partial [Acidobacteria bacterium]|nr:hypothetical protein [Acidobacteriota bacterium]
MRSSTTRTLTALMLALSMWAGAISAVAAPLQQQQTQEQAKQQDAKDKKAPDAQKQTATTAQQTQTTSSTSRKPLSVNEDPSMIGKRKINSGLIAKMAGSLEKEVALGRALAAEVDKQAKFVEDPLIT